MYIKVCFESSWQKQSQEIIIVSKHSLKGEYLNIFFYISMNVSFFTADCPLKKNFCVYLSSCVFKNILLLLILMVIISFELTRMNPDGKIFSVKCGTKICFINSMRFGPPSSLNLKQTKMTVLYAKSIIVWSNQGSVMCLLSILNQ